MKYDMSKKPSKFVERAFSDFHRTLFKMLEEIPLESITVQELCDRSNYPRATFYNYFDDISDLLSYSWVRIGQTIKLDDFEEMPDEERTGILLSRIYDFFEKQQQTIKRILRHNAMDGRMITSLQKAIREQSYAMLIKAPCPVVAAFPQEMIAEHYANIIQLVLEWSFLHKKKLSKQEALKILHYFEPKG